MPRPKRDVTRVNMYLQNKVLAALKILAKKRGVPYAEVVRQALRQYVIDEVKRENG